jgi:hypothetical protein
MRLPNCTVIPSLDPDGKFRAALRTNSAWSTRHFHWFAERIHGFERLFQMLPCFAKPVFEQPGYFSFIVGRYGSLAK